MSGIEWTDETWNPTLGCSRVSAGCEHCYAERFAHRGLSPSHHGLTVDSGKGPRWTGEVRLLPERLDQPLRWRKPRRIFVDSMSDLFHESVPDEFIDRVFAVMALCPQHTFQVLTKRPERMRDYLKNHVAGGRHIWTAAQRIEMPGGRHKAETSWPLPNVWLGASIENQETADERIPHLLATPAAVRFVSAEPLLGPVDLDPARMFPTDECFQAPPKIDLVIVGGESGPGARPCNVEWIRSIVQECKAAGTACFVKQLGAKPEGSFDSIDGRGRLLKSRKGADMDEWPEDLRVREMPK